MSQRFKITETTSGQTFLCQPGQSLLKGMESSGARCVPVGCRGGGCGLCKITVVAGDYECGKMSKRHVPDDGVSCRNALACRVFPLSHLVIEKCRDEMRDQS